MNTNTVPATGQVAPTPKIIPLEFKVNRYDNMRSYTPDEVIASFQSVNAKIPDFKSSIKYAPATEQYKTAMNFTGEVFVGILKASASSNFHSSNYEELQLRSKDDILQLVSDIADEVLSPTNDDIRAKQPNTITKWYWDANEKILFVQTSRLKNTASDLMLHSERIFVEKALDAITSLTTA